MIESTMKCTKRRAAETGCSHTRTLRASVTPSDINCAKVTGAVGGQGFKWAGFGWSGVGLGLAWGE